MKMRIVIPVVRLDYRKTLSIALAVNAPVIVVRVQDVISKRTGKPNYIFKKIVACGGVHNFLNYRGFIILSLIMKDGLIRKFSEEEYAEIINGLRPNAYTTVDGETYDKKERKSARELLRLSKQTKELLKLCPNIKPIGNVKGCNEMQIKLHVEFLRKLGINTFIFHVGDFFRNGDENMIQKARHFCSLIKNENNKLFLYGFGAQKRLFDFSFADGYITYGHVVNAKNRKCFAGKRKRTFNNLTFEEAAIKNLKQMLLNLKDTHKQLKLFEGGKCIWVEVHKEPSFAIQGQKIRM